MILIKTAEEIAVMRQAGQKLAGVMRQLVVKVEPGCTTKELDKLACQLISNAGGTPSFKGFGGFPAALCVAVNEQIVHGVPSDRQLADGDIVSLDLGLGWQGWHADMAVTVPVGSVEPEALRLIRVTKKALKRAISRVKPGKTLGDVGQAIQTYVEGQGFHLPRELCGHGIGRSLHEKPEVLNFGQRHKGLELKAGMVLAIEPMVIMGQPGAEKGADGFVWQTVDKSLVAHFEHTVAVTPKGHLVLTE